jgi:predicted secreted protein
MSKKSGRNLVIKKGSDVIAAIRNKTVAWNGEPIDVTSDDDSGFRALLSDAQGQEQIDLSGDGLTDNAILRDIAFAPATSKMLTDITIEWTDTGEIIAGDFKLVSYEESGTYNDARTFTFSLQSSEAWTYTPAS